MLILATYLGNSIPILLDKISSGVSTFQLPNGPQEDSYKIQIYVEVLDDSDGITEFVLSNTVIVEPNDEIFTNLSNDLLNLNDQSSSLLNNLKNDSVQSTTTFISCFVSMIDLSSTVILTNQSTNLSNSTITNIQVILYNLKW